MNDERRSSMRMILMTLVGAMLALSPLAVHAQLSIAQWEAEGRALEKATGIPRFPLPNNLPPQDQPAKDLSRCNLGLAGRSSYISLWLKKPDCEAWIQRAIEYNQKYGVALEQAKARQVAEQNRIAEARRQQQAGAGARITYALFLCVPATGRCEMQGAPRMTFAGAVPAMTFQSLAACGEYAQRASGLITPPTEGRFMLPSGLWYECRGKKVDTWERVR